MKRLITVVLVVGIFLSFNSFAESSITGGTGNRPTTSIEVLTSDTWDNYSIGESIVPFKLLKWGMSQEEVINTVGGAFDDTQTDLQSILTIPGFNGTHTVNYFFDDTGLESISMILSDPLGSSELEQLGSKIDDFFEANNPDEYHIKFNNPPDGENTYKSTVSDITINYNKKGLSHFQLAIAVLDLRQRGMTVIVAENVGVEQFTVFARHFQRGMTELLLKRESVSTTIKQIFPRKGMTEKMNGGLFHAARTVITPDGVAQTAFGHLAVELIGEQVIIIRALADCQILLKDDAHFSAQRRNLRFLVLGVPEITQPAL